MGYLDPVIILYVIQMNKFHGGITDVSATTETLLVALPTAKQSKYLYTNVPSMLTKE